MNLDKRILDGNGNANAEDFTDEGARRDEGRFGKTKSHGMALHDKNADKDADTLADGRS